MKRILTFLIVFCCFSSSMIWAQTQCPGCVISIPANTPADTIYLENPPPATQGQYYEQDLSFRLPKTTTPFCNTLPNVPCNLTIDQIKILGLAGLPFGVNYTLNNPTGVYVPATQPDGCIRLCGTPLVADTFIVSVSVEATVFGQVQAASFPLEFIVNPQTFTGVYSVSPTAGCAPMAVNFSTNLPQRPGVTVGWNFGNGTQSNLFNPPAQTYPTAGSYPITFNALIDTVGYFLTNITINSTTCNDFNPLSPDPELYVKILNASGANIYESTPPSAGAAPPVIISIPSPIPLQPNANYTMEVWNDDAPLNDELCGTITFSTATNGQISVAGLSVTVTVSHPTTTITENTTVEVFPAAAIPTISPVNLAICAGDTLPLSTNLTEGLQWFQDSIPVFGATAPTFGASAAGVYWVQHTNSSGCSAISPTATAIINEPPTTPIFFQFQGTLTLTNPASLPTAYSLQWFQNGQPIAGATGQVYVATVPGIYALQVTDLLTNCSTLYSSNVIAVSTQNLTWGNTLQISPNPAQTHFTLTATMTGNENLNLRLVDVLGRVILQKELFSTGSLQEKVEVSTLTKGIYFVHLANENQETVVRKLVIE